MNIIKYIIELNAFTFCSYILLISLSIFTICGFWQVFKQNKKIKTEPIGEVQKEPAKIGWLNIIAYSGITSLMIFILATTKLEYMKNVKIIYLKKNDGILEKQEKTFVQPYFLSSKKVYIFDEPGFFKEPYFVKNDTFQFYYYIEEDQQNINKLISFLDSEGGSIFHQDVQSGIIKSLPKALYQTEDMKEDNMFLRLKDFYAERGITLLDVKPVEKK